MECYRTYRGFIVSWQDMPVPSTGWTLTIASESAEIRALLKRATGSETLHVIGPRENFDPAMQDAERFIDTVLGD